MNSKSVAAMKPSSPTAGASPTAGTGIRHTPEIVAQVRRAMHPVKEAYARNATERRIEAGLGFAIIYALGPADGVALKLGVASSDLALQKELKTAQHYSSSLMIVHVRAFLAGKPVALRLKAAVEAQLESQGRRVRGSWHRVDAVELSGLMVTAAREIGAELFDEAERQRRVLEAVQREMERALRG